MSYYLSKWHFWGENGIYEVKNDIVEVNIIFFLVKNNRFEVKITFWGQNDMLEVNNDMFEVKHDILRSRYRALFYSGNHYRGLSHHESIALYFGEVLH